MNIVKIKIIVKRSLSHISLYSEHLCELRFYGTVFSQFDFRVKDPEDPV